VTTVGKLYVTDFVSRLFYLTELVELVCIVYWFLTSRFRPQGPWCMVSTLWTSVVSVVWSCKISCCTSSIWAQLINLCLLLDMYISSILNMQITCEKWIREAPSKQHDSPYTYCSLRKESGAAN
jgi:hypothetical protein